MAKEINRDNLYKGFNRIDALSCEAFDDVFYCRSDAYIPRTIEALCGIVESANNLIRYLKESSGESKKSDGKYSKKSVSKMLDIADDIDVRSDIRLRSINSAIDIINILYFKILERIDFEVKQKEEGEE